MDSIILHQWLGDKDRYFRLLRGELTRKQFEKLVESFLNNSETTGISGWSIDEENNWNNHYLKDPPCTWDKLETLTAQ